MGKKIKVEITAEQTIHLSKTVEMDELDYKSYLSIQDNKSNLSKVAIDELIGEIAFKYDLNNNDCDHENDPENIDFELIK
jgi:hypothetical protein